MKLKKHILYKLLAVFTAVVAIYACQRDDAEPDLEMRKFSRLYVSFEDYQDGSGQPTLANVRVLYPADSSVFDKFSIEHISKSLGGGAIYYNPYLKMVFQATKNFAGTDTLVYSMSVGEKNGTLSNSGYIGDKSYTYVKGLAYQRASNVLFMVNGDGTPNSSIYVVDRPSTRNNIRAAPLKRYRTPNLLMWGAAYQDNKLFVSKQGSDGAILVFKDVVTKPVSTVDSTATLDYHTLKIEDVTNLRGLFYDTLKNVLAITDYTDGTTAGTGRILIFDNFKELVGDANKTITPTRIITGTSTGLTQPLDVAIDTRATGEYLYVADRGAKKVFRFKYKDNGNVVPNKELKTTVTIAGQQRDVTPVALALDTRDDSTLGQ